MKNFFYIAAMMLAGIILFSCKPKERDPFCDGQVYEHLDMSNYAFFQFYADSTRDGVHYKTGYVEGNGSTPSNYYAEMSFGNLCTLYPPMIEFEVLINNSGDGTAYVEEPGKTGRTDIQLEATGFSYSKNFQYTFQDGTGNTPGNVLLHMQFAFPYQGSQSADSLYFFGTMQQMNIHLSGYRPG